VVQWREERQSQRVRERRKEADIEEFGKDLSHSIQTIHKEGNMRCKHGSCKCSAVEGKNGYCSDDCAKGKMDGNRCGCGRRGAPHGRVASAAGHYKAAREYVPGSLAPRKRHVDTEDAGQLA
jgi:hypothetical protein